MNLDVSLIPLQPPSLEQFLEHSPCPIQTLDLDGRILFSNRAVEKVFGSLPPPGYSCFQDPILLRLGVVERMRKAIDGEVVWIPPVWCDLEQGPTQALERGQEHGGPSCKKVRVQSSAFPLCDGEGRVEKVLLVHTHLPGENSMESLHGGDERFRALCEHSIDSLFWIRVEDDGNFCVEGLNPEQERILGMKTDAVVGKRLQDFLSPETAQNIANRYQACLALGQAMRYEEDLNFQGEVRTFQTMIVPMRDDSGRIHRIIGSSRDITWQKREEERRRLAQKRESLGLLAGGIAHDFNNLLTAMRGNLDLCLLQIEEESPLRLYLDRLGHIISKASDLTRQMLAYSGKGRFVVEPHQLSRVVGGMMELLQASIPKKIKLKPRLALELPMVQVDLTQMHQVILALVSNAWEAIGEDEGVVSIATEWRGGYPGNMVLDPQSTAEGYVVLLVGDTGCGMSQEVLDKIFDPFFSTKQSGRGLGLPAVHGILKSHGAGIQVESLPGAGSCITLFFPALPDLVPVQEDEPPAEAVKALHGRILLVDDEAFVRQSTAAMLDSLGFSVEVAVDGMDAVEKFQLHHQAIDLVLMDVTMPRLDGREALQRIRGLREDIPVILCSGFSENEVFHGVSHPGLLRTAPLGFLQKPFTLQLLEACLRDVLP